ncbi:MAG: c-type cytochrome [Mariprofundaceae bacterium]|nr:c-type cytochrome [Mariprofundaceae bacterium]
MLKYIGMILVCCLTACQGEESSTTIETPQLKSNPVENVSTQDVRKKDEKAFIASDITAEKSVSLMNDLSTPLTANVEHGKKLMQKRCLMCHFMDKNKRKVGPSLQGIYGRTPSIDGVPFSVWDDNALNQWLANPKAIKPTTRMGFPGFKKEQDRLDVIAYLKSLS